MNRGVNSIKNHPALNDFKTNTILNLYKWLGGKDGLEIHLLEYPKFTVYRGKIHIDSFKLSAVERRIIWKHLKELS